MLTVKSPFSMPLMLFRPEIVVPVRETFCVIPHFQILTVQPKNDFVL